MTIYFDENKEAYAQIETLNKWGKTLLYQCSDNEYKEFKDGKRIWQGNELVVNPDYETEQAQKEAERIAMLKLTRGDVFRALLLAKGVTREQIKAQLEAMPMTTTEEQITRELALIDFDEALDFYRGNPLIDTVGLSLGITKEQLDSFFQTNDYNDLISEENNA